MKEYKRYRLRKATKYLNVSIPVEWTEKLDPKRGDILHFEGEGNVLIIRFEKKEAPVATPE